MTERFKPNTTVATIIYCAGKYLMVEELIDGQVRFNQPAGHLEANESILSACKREVLEETGLHIEPAGLVGIYQFSASSGVDFVRFTFCVDLPVQVNYTPLDSAITRTHWFTREQISDKQAQLRSPLVLQSIDDYINQNGQYYSLSLLNSPY